MQRLHPHPLVHYGLIIMIFSVGAFTLFSLTVVHALNGESGHHAHNAVCDNVGKIVSVTIQNQRFSPADIQANRCDELIITNKDQRLYRVALGEHARHTLYPGFTEQSLHTGDQQRVILSRIGHYMVHDHLHAATEAELTVR